MPDTAVAHGKTGSDFPSAFISAMRTVEGRTPVLETGTRLLSRKDVSTTKAAVNEIMLRDGDHLCSIV